MRIWLQTIHSIFFKYVKNEMCDFLYILPKYRQFNAIFIIFLIHICKKHMCQSCPTSFDENHALYMTFYAPPVHFPSFLVEISSDFFRISKVLLYWITIIPPEMNGHVWPKCRTYIFGEIKWDKLDPCIVFICNLMLNVVV